MKPLIHPSLINGPFEDPGLYIEIRWERRSILFDLGDITHIEPAKLLKVSDVFVSHTHMDHFVGFDYLLRMVLNRAKALRLYGPPGILDNVEGRLKGYTWNLTEEYPLILEVTEVYPDKIKRGEFRARDGFKHHDRGHSPFSGTLRNEDMFAIHTCHLDHKIPSLGFALKERFHININKDKLTALNLPVGPWLRRFKEALWKGRPEDAHFTVTYEVGGKREAREVPLGELRERVATITKGQKISYITDAVYSADNEEKIVHLVKDSDILYCEAAYLEKDRDIALERAHLTARQAGDLARKGGAKDLVIFHFSPRYRDDPDALYREAIEAFRG